jgi:hypothetical protein
MIFTTNIIKKRNPEGYSGFLAAENIRSNTEAVGDYKNTHTINI